MKLKPASRKELNHIAVGTLICSAVMVVVFLVLHLTGIYRSVFWQVLFSALAGSLVAIGNFALLCLTVQSAAEKADNPGAVKARVQTSYTARLALQGLWCIVAFLVPSLQVVAAVLPLLFPRVVIQFLQFKERKRSQAAPAEGAQQAQSLPPEQER